MRMQRPDPRTIVARVTPVLSVYDVVAARFPRADSRLNAADLVDVNDRLLSVRLKGEAAVGGVGCSMGLSVLALDDDESATFAVPSGRILVGPEQLSLPKAFAPKATVQPGEPSHGEPDWLLKLKSPLYQVVVAFRAFHSVVS